MPAAALMEPLNEILGRPGEVAYQNVAEVSAAAASVRAVLEGINVLEAFAEPIGIEARAVLDALPAAVDGALLGALRAACDRGMPIRLRWVEAESIALRVSEGRGHVRITLETPHGTEFV